MRPTRLELAGFGSWVDPTVIDFTDADLFALTGDTGAGKSTLLDAICFGLYGKAPRHGKRDVEPLINRSTNEARVRLDFVLDGTPLTVTRILRRKPDGGATTREARLERFVTTPDGDEDTEPIVSGAKEVSGAVEERIGLTWEHFTSAVILPQGRFQEFLHATPSDQRDLLKELLRLGVFEQAKQRVGQRARDHAAHEQAVANRLEELRDATPEAVAAAEKQLHALDELVSVREKALAEIEGLREEHKAAQAAAERIGAQLDALDDVRVPDGLDELAAARTEAATVRAKAADALAEAEKERAEAVEHREKLPETGALRSLLDSFDEIERRTQALAEAERAVEPAAKTAAAAATDKKAADAALLAARRELDEAMRHDHAAAAAADLHAGDPCPVCGRKLAADPAIETADVSAARAAVETAQQDVDTADQRVATASRQLAVAEGGVETARKELATAQERAATQAAALDLPNERTAAAETLASTTTADKALKATEESLTAARRADAKAATNVEAAERALRELDDQFRETAARLLSRDLDPPSATPEDDLRDRWQALVTWATNTHADVVRARDEIAGTITQIGERGQRLRSEVIQAAAHIDLEVRSANFDEITRAHARQQATLEQLRHNVETASRLREDARRHKSQRELADQLAAVLRRDRLEQWLLSRVLRQLVAGASTHFHELSDRTYSLRLADDATIEVVDHANADLARSVQSLSGGETFLASLSLALALADEVATLATDGAARLDALFIDEGFGTLDAETLDTVAAALQQLGEGGRMIGVVTHVRDLADQMPLRFEIAKVGPASTVRRSDEREAA